MYSPFQLAKKYLHYWVTASNGKGHGVHSPFVFDFITKLLNDKKAYGPYEPVEALRQQLKSSKEIITVDDFGAGSRTGASRQRTVSSIANNALKPKKYSQLLFRMVQYYQPKQIVELGTSLGITSSYLAAANPGAMLHTMEGAVEIAAIAKRNFTRLGLNNISLHQGNFDETLFPLLEQLKSIDLAFIDGNHRHEPTVRYFKAMLPYCQNDSIMVFDDIHWSKEMEQAWEEIKNDSKVLLSIDLFFIGIVFFRQEFKVKQHFSIRF